MGPTYSADPGNSKSAEKRQYGATNPQKPARKGGPVFYHPPHKKQTKKSNFKSPHKEM